MRRVLVVLVVSCALVSCLGTTGYDLVTFYAAVQGPPDAVTGKPYAFTNDQGFHVVLQQATLYVGALYLNQSVPTSGEGAEPCILPGIYVGEVRGGGPFDMLSPDRQGFPVTGDGSTIPAALGQVWLVGTGGDVNATDDSTTILALAGTAEKGGSTYPFSAGITIDQNREPAPSASALPGENPICLQRIVTPILTSISLSQSGTLVLNVDPKALFLNVDFSELPEFSTDPPTYGFTNDGSNQPSVNLYDNLRAAGQVYRFTWKPAGS